jgi:hypothetical protein
MAAPNLGAETVDNPPIKLPIGVLTAETITTLLLITYIMLVYVANLIFYTNFDFHLGIIFFENKCAFFRYMFDYELFL